MKEKLSNEENMKAVMENCCGIMEARSGMPTGSQNKSEQQIDKKGKSKLSLFKYIGDIES